MQFITFIRQLNAQGDTDVQAFLTWALALDYFPHTSNPALHLLFFSDKLTIPQSEGYKKAMIQYAAFSKNQLPDKFRDRTTFIATIDSIGVQGPPH